MAETPAASTEESFSVYQLLPNELKDDIWRKAAFSPGVHHFKMAVDNAHFIADRQRIQFTPAWSPKYDVSAWRIRNKIAQIDECSWDVVKRLVNGPSSKRIWPYQQDTRDPNKPGAIIDCENDIVFIHFSGGVTNVTLLPMEHPNMLSGIKHITMEYKKSSESHHWPWPAFSCQCRGRRHEGFTHCPKPMCEFFRYFPDLETFYFAVKLSSRKIRRGKKRNRKGEVIDDDTQQAQSQATRTTASQIVAQAFKQYRDIAQQKDLANFEDAECQYCEVLEMDTLGLTIHEILWANIRSIRDRCADLRNKYGVVTNEIKIGVLLAKRNV